MTTLCKQYSSLQDFASDAGAVRSVFGPDVQKIKYHEGLGKFTFAQTAHQATLDAYAAFLKLEPC